MKPMMLIPAAILIAAAGLPGQWEILNEGIENLYSIDFIDEDTGWIAGGTGHPLVEKASLFKTEDGGDTWAPLALEGNFNIEMIDFIDDSVGWAIGNTPMFTTRKGFVHKTSDGGQTWVLQKTTPEHLVLRSIQAINDTLCYISGNDYQSEQSTFVVLKTSDGGINWIDITPSNSNEGVIESIRFFNDRIGLVAGYSGDSIETFIFKTNDGGMTWTKTTIPTFASIRNV